MSRDVSLGTQLFGEPPRYGWMRRELSANRSVRKIFVKEFNRARDGEIAPKTLRTDYFKTCLVGLAVLPVDGPDAGLIFFERIEVDHPVKNDWVKSSAGRGAGFFGSNRSMQTELRMRN